MRTKDKLDRENRSGLRRLITPIFLASFLSACGPNTHGYCYPEDTEACIEGNVILTPEAADVIREITSAFKDVGIRDASIQFVRNRHRRTHNGSINYELGEIELIVPEERLNDSALLKRDLYIGSWYAAFGNWGGMYVERYFEDPFERISNIAHERNLNPARSPLSLFDYSSYLPGTDFIADHHFMAFAASGLSVMREYPTEFIQNYRNIQASNSLTTQEKEAVRGAVVDLLDFVELVTNGMPEDRLELLLPQYEELRELVQN